MFKYLLVGLALLPLACQKNSPSAPSNRAAKTANRDAHYPSLGDPRANAAAAIARGNVELYMVKDPTDDVWVVPSYAQGASKLQMENRGYPYIVNKLVEDLPTHNREKLREYYIYAVVYNDTIMQYVTKNPRRDPTSVMAPSPFDIVPPTAIRPTPEDESMYEYPRSIGGAVNHESSYK